MVADVALEGVGEVCTVGRSFQLVSGELLLLEQGHARAELIQALRSALELRGRDPGGPEGVRAQLRKKRVKTL